LAFLGIGTRTAKKNRVFHHISAIVATIATLSYFALATGSGSTFIYQGHKFIQGKEVASFRQVPYAHYIDAALTTPMILFELGLVAGLSWLDIASVLVANEGWVITQLVASLSHRGRAMWGWYTFSCLFLIYVAVTLLWKGRKTSRLQSEHVPLIYTGSSLLIVTLWVVYTVAFALGNGTDVINVDVEIIIYVVLDIIAKSAFGFGLVAVHTKHSDDHAGTIPEYWTEPRSHRRIRLPGADN